MPIIVRGDAPNTFDLRGITYEQGMLKLAANGKSLVLNPKLNITDCDLSFKDAEGKEYPLVFANAASVRLPFMTPTDMAAEIIDEEVVSRKNTDRESNGKKLLLSKSAKKRNRIKKAQIKWRDENVKNNNLNGIIFSELVADARNEYIEENSEARINRKVLAAQKRREAGTYSVAECEAAIVVTRLMLSEPDVDDDFRVKLLAKVAELEAVILKAQGGTVKDVTGANLLTNSTLEEHLAATV